MATYSRENPSLRYIELLGYYQQMHEKGAITEGMLAEKTFQG